MGTFAPAVLGDEIATMSTETIIPTVISRCLESGFLGLIIILILSASMSTLSSIALASSSSVAVDIYKGYIKKEASDKEINILLRLLCFVFIVISVLFALLNISSIVALMSFSWGTLSGCFLAPYIYGLYSKRATKAAAYTAIFAGLAITLIGYILSVSVVSLKPFLTPPAIGVAAMTINMILMPIVSRFTTPLESSEVDKLMVVLKQK